VRMKEVQFSTLVNVVTSGIRITETVILHSLLYCLRLGSSISSVVEVVY